MALSDYIAGVKIAKERRIAREKEKSLHGTTVMMGIYADNAVSKFKTEYFIQSNKGKRSCTVHFNPYPDATIMKKVLKRITKKEYLKEFESVLAEKLEQQGFTDFSLSENVLNTKEPATLKVKW